MTVGDGKVLPGSTIMPLFVCVPTKVVRRTFNRRTVVSGRSA